MTASALFQPLTVGPVTLRNRIWIAPMCQYSVAARDGVPTDWHLVHLGALAAGGPGLVIAEATAVSPEGRITPQDTGIWNDAQRDAWARIARFVATQGAVPGIQLQHAGRRASSYAPWGFDGLRGTVPAADGGWPTVGPSPIAFPGYATPAALDETGLAQVVADFGAAARRAVDAGFRVLEIHAAHGYLLHQFLSPLSNARTDAYGGSLENRARLLLRVVEAVAEAASGVAAVFVRLSATDWTEGGLTEADAAVAAGWARAHGADWIDVSTGGNVPAEIPVGPGYQVPAAAYLRAHGAGAVSAVGLITEAEQAEQIVATGQADAVLIARAALRDPHTPIRWARELGVDDAALWPPQYLRAR